MSMFSARHYVWLAKALGEILQTETYATDREIILNTIIRLAHALEADNPKFDFKRFVQAARCPQERAPAEGLRTQTSKLPN